MFHDVYTRQTLDFVSIFLKIYTPNKSIETFATCSYMCVLSAQK